MPSEPARSMSAASGDRGVLIVLAVIAICLGYGASRARAEPCPEGSYRDRDTDECVRCPEGSTWDGDEGSCVECDDDGECRSVAGEPDGSSTSNPPEPPEPEPTTSEPPEPGPSGSSGSRCPPGSDWNEDEQACEECDDDGECITLAAGRCSISTRKKVLLIGLDGTKAVVVQALAGRGRLKALAGLMKSGQYSFDGLADTTTSSASGWVGMLTGRKQAAHGLTSNTTLGGLRRNSRRNASVKHFFAWLKGSRARCGKAACKLRTVSIASWAPIKAFVDTYPGIADLSSTPGSSVGQHLARDKQVLQASLRELRSGDPDVMFVHFDNVDHMGHLHGYDVKVPQYTKALEDTDGRVGQLLQAVNNRSCASSEDWLVIVSTDHGGPSPPCRGKCQHHQGNAVNRRVFVIASGGSYSGGTPLTVDPELVDIVPTILDHLNVPRDRSLTGNTMR